MNGWIILFSFCLFLGLIYANNAACTTDDDCPEYEYCSEGSCECLVLYSRDKDGTCRGALEAECYDDSVCLGNNTECFDGLCSCKKNYHDADEYWGDGNDCILNYPSAPENARWLEKYKNSIVVTWEIPEQPNGLITKFKIDIYRKDDGLFYLQTEYTNSSTSVYQADWLKTETTYQFRVYSVNELHTSKTYSTIDCATVEKDGPLGTSCDVNKGDQCSFADAQCLSNGSSGICTCGPDFFDTNGFISGGSCSHTENLIVSDVEFKYIKTDGFFVSWQAPSIYPLLVSKYVVQLTPDGKSESISFHRTFAHISGLTPGRLHSVSITSYVDGTEEGRLRTKSATKHQATKPAYCELTEENTDLDASNNSITLSWKLKAGVVSGYHISILEGFEYVTSTNVNTESTSPSKQFTSPKLRNGVTYTVVMNALSEPNISGVRLEGEGSITRIRTASSK